MFHIEQRTGGACELHLRLEGDLDREHVIALENVVREAKERGIPRFVVHCAGLHSVDEAGVSFLSLLRLSGAILTEVPLLVGWKLAMKKHLVQE